MLAVCHGDAKSGATHVPVGLQQHVKRIGTALNATCAVTDDAFVTCWGTGIAEPDAGTYCAGAAQNVALANVNGTVTGAIQCPDAIVLWNGSILATATGASGLDASPTALCFVSNTSAACFGAAVPSVYDGQTGLVIAGDAGGCVSLAGQDSVSCFGLYSQTDVPWRPGHALQGGALSGGAMCFQWDDGWACQTASGAMGPEESAAMSALTTLWSLAQTSPSSGPLDFDALDVAASWGSVTGSLCVIRTQTNQAWCQGTGFNVTGDVVDGVYTINAENTADAKFVSVAPSHVCVVVADPTSVWPWVVFGIILLFILLGFALAWRHYRKEAMLASNPFRFVGYPNSW